MTDKIILTVPEAAKLLGVNVSYIYKEANRPGFPAHRRTPRGQIFINRDALIKWFSR
jgi:excisionase family DNA binding protein